jgi:hypothetical protein
MIGRVFTASLLVVFYRAAWRMAGRVSAQYAKAMLDENGGMGKYIFPATGEKSSPVDRRCFADRYKTTFLRTLHIPSIAHTLRLCAFARGPLVSA